MHQCRDVRVRGLRLLDRRPKQLRKVRSLAQEHHCSAQEVNWHLSSYQSTLCKGT